MTHPSFFALDGHALDPRSGEVATHLATCAQCQAHVAALRVAAPFPAQLASLPTKAAPAWGRFLTLGVAAAAVLLGVAWVSKREPSPQFTAKGTPTAALWVSREGKVVAWNGQPLHVGDAVRIEVAPAGFTHVTVFDEHTQQVLYEAQIPDASPTLTPAWQFDGKSPSESLRVVLSREAVDFGTPCVTNTDSHCTRFPLKLE